MKNLILSLAIVFSLQGRAQILQGAELNTVGQIKGDGTVLDEAGKLAGKIKKDGMVTNASSVITGYIKPDGSIENEAHAVVGFVKEDGEILGPDKKTIGYIKEGVVTNEKNETIGYAKNIPVKWAAVYFFFLF